MITKQQLRQENALEDWFSSNAISSKVAAAKAKQRLRDYRPDPTTGKQKPGVLVRFGLVSIDNLMSMLRGCYYLVAARARTGKSAFAMQVAESAMKQLEGTGKKIAIFSAEMDAASLVGREACAAERVSYWHMVKGLLTPDQYDAVERRMDDIGESAFWLDETSSPTIEHMIEQLDALQQDKGGIGLVIFDYLELAGDYEREEVKRIAKISRGLKAIAKKFECPVLALGQLNRDIDRRTDKKPSLADLMYGGEREPDGIMVLHRPSLYDDTIKKQRIGDKEVELTECHVIKHRHGPGGIAHIAFEESTMRFFSAEVQRTNLEASK